MRSNVVTIFKKYIALSWGAIFIGMVMMLPGCGRRGTDSGVVKSRPLLQEQQARLIDIAFPVDMVLKQTSTVVKDGELQRFVAGVTKLSLPALKDFYCREMEQLGWRELVIFEEGHPSLLLLFEKPRKVCTVVIEQHKRVNYIRYYIAPRLIC